MLKGQHALDIVQPSTHLRGHIQRCNPWAERLGRPTSCCGCIFKQLIGNRGKKGTNLRSHQNCDRFHEQRPATQSFQRLRLRCQKQRWVSFQKQLPGTCTDRLNEWAHMIQTGRHAQGCQPGNAYLRTGCAFRQKMPEASAICTLVPSPLREE